jgi:DNA ligase-associated metallophosphoesterase
MAFDKRWLDECVKSRRVLPFKFNGHLMLIDYRLAVYWVSKRMLIVSDLHLEKGSYLSQFANPIPNYDSLATLKRLLSLIDDYKPDSVISLGDSIHDTHAFSRITQANKNLLQAVIDKVPQWHWVLGNHDPKLPLSFGKEQHTFLEMEKIGFCHEPSDSVSPQIFGHFHPKATHKSRKLKINGPCLLYNETRLIMPAFGQYTGGLTIDDPVFDNVMRPLSDSDKRPRNEHGFIIKDKTIVPFTRTRYFK